MRICGGERISTVHHTASKLNARARHSLIPERASVDNEARVTSGHDFDSSRPSLKYLTLGLLSVPGMVLQGDIICI
jgi:hypothetical protein